MYEFQSCENNSECGTSFRNLTESYNNPMMCSNPEMCIEDFKPSDAAGLELYNAVTSCYSMDPQCMPFSGSGSGSGSGSSSGFADCGSTPSRPVRNS